MRNKSHIIFHKCLYVLFLIPFVLHSQEKYDLKHCIETGLERNLKIKITRNNQKISDNNLTLGNAGFFPTVNFSSGYSGSVNNIKQFPADESDAIISNGINNSRLDAGVYLNWTVFDGFSVKANYARLKELQQSGELNSRLTIENFVSDLTVEYFNFVQQNIRLNNLKSAMKLSKERLRIVEARYKIGSLSRLDLQQAKVDFNADSSKLIRQQEVLFTSRIKINQLMALDNIEKMLVPVDSTIRFNSLLSKEIIFDKMMKMNSFILLAEKEKNLIVLDLKSIQSKNYPYLKVNAGYGFSQNNYEVATYKQQNNLGLNYGITLGYNLFDGFNRLRQQKNAKIQVENKELAYEELKLSLKSDFSNIWMAYKNNLELTILEEENLSNAKENYEIAIDRYKLGDLSGIELREAQNSLLEAEERLVQAQYNTKLCEISLMQISGQVTEYFK